MTSSIKQLASVAALSATLLTVFSFQFNDKAQAQGGGAQGPFLGQPVTVTRFNGDVRSLPKATSPENHKGLPVKPVPQNLLPHAPVPVGPDPVRQTRATGPNAPIQGQSFEGLRGGDPPDTNADVGPNHIIESINVSFQIYDKSGNTLAGPTNISSLFSANGGTGTPCDNGFTSDPVVLYDAQADRWIITILALNDFYNGPYYECIAVSQTNDPVAGGWYRYPLIADSIYLNDYPKLGVWPDAYYMMTDDFDEVPCGTPPCPENFQFVRVYSINRAKMLAGQSLLASDFQHFDVTGYFSMVPSNFKGTTAPPAGRPNYFGVSDYGGSSTIHIFRFHVDFTTPANSWFGTSMGNPNPVNVTVPAYSTPSVAPPQPGTTVTLDTLGTRLMYQFQYRNIGGTESLWADHTVDAGSGTNGVRWYQFDVTGDVIAAAPVQSGTFSPDSTHRWMGHLAANQFGDMAVGYTVSSSSVYPGVRYTGRLAGDALGTLQSEATLINGSGVFIDCSPTPCGARWGDYSSMEVDPVDDCTFWHANEYVDSTSNVTRIGAFRFADCMADVGVSKTGPATVIAGTDLTYNLTVNNSGPLPAVGVMLTDATPTNTTFVSFTQNTGATFTCTTPSVGSTGTVSCTIGGLANGASATFAYVVHVDPSTPDGTILSNTANVTTVSNDTNSSNDSSTVNTTVQTEADLGIVKTHTVTGFAGSGQVTWHIAITNYGPSDAQNVAMTDALDITQTSYVSATPDGGGSCNFVSPTVTCTWTTVPYNATVHVDIVADLLPNALNLCNTADVTSSTTDPGPHPNSSQDCFVVPTKAKVSIVKKGVVVGAGREIKYTLTVKNAGPSFARNVKVTDKLDTATSYVSATTTQGTCSYSAGNTTVKCNIGDMALTTVTLQIEVKIVKSVKQVDNTANVTSTTFDPNLKDNTSTITVTLGGSFEWNEGAPWVLWRRDELRV